MPHVIVTRHRLPPIIALGHRIPDRKRPPRHLDVMPATRNQSSRGLNPPSLENLSPAISQEASSSLQPQSQANSSGAGAPPLRTSPFVAPSPGPFRASSPRDPAGASSREFPGPSPAFASPLGITDGLASGTEKDGPQKRKPGPLLDGVGRESKRSRAKGDALLGGSEEAGSLGGADDEGLLGETEDEVLSGDVELDTFALWSTNLVVGDSKHTLQISSAQRELAEQLRSAEIGGAFVRFVGPGELDGVVNMRNNPNFRGNPRGLDQPHVTRLYDAFRVPDGKKDHEAPVFLAVSRKLLSSELQESMQNANPRDPSASLPLLQLARPNAAEEDTLEEALWSHVMDGRWLEPQELTSMSGRLSALREGRERAVLLNGHHRLRAMGRIGEDLLRERQALFHQIRDGTTPREELADRLPALRDKAANATWRVLVYDKDRLTPALRNALVKNEREKPAKGMGAGEVAWWLAEKFVGLIDEAITEHGFKRREDAANHARIKWLALSEVQHSSNTNEDASDDEVASSKRPRGKKTVGSALAPAEGVDEVAIADMFSDPCCMEAMVDCRSALFQVTELLPRPFMAHVVRRWGASALAHLWLSTRLLTQIFDVKYGEGHAEAAEFLKSSELTDGGDLGAIQHWVKIHSRPEQSPILLQRYSRKEAAYVDECYFQWVAPLCSSPRGVDFESDRTYRTMRNAFEALGLRWSQKHGDSDAQLIATSFRLYARLPRFDPQHPSTPCFHPTTLLPAPGSLWEVANRWATTLPDDGLAAFEMLLERWQLAWTLGAQTTSRATNPKNWYRRSRGLHQVVLAHFEHEALGPVEYRLSQAIVALDDVRLPRALLALKSPDGRRLREIFQACCAQKSASPSYPIMDHFIIGTEWERKGALKTREAIRKARESLKRLVFESSLEVLDEVRRHKVLVDLIPHTFWDEFSFREWVQGWNDTKAKQMGSIIAALGWGFVGAEVWNNFVLPALRRSHETHYLLKIAADIARMKGSTPWWSYQITPNVPDRLETPPPAPVVAQPAPATSTSRKPAAVAKVGSRKPTVVPVTKGHNTSTVPQPLPQVTSPPDCPPTRSTPAGTANDTNQVPAEGDGPEHNAMAYEIPSQPPAEPPVQPPAPLQPSRPAANDVPSRDSPAPVPETSGGKDPLLCENIRKAVPDHIYVRPCFDTSILSNVEGRVVPRQGNNELMPLETVNHRIDNCVITADILRHIEDERRYMRQSVRDLATMCATSPFGSEFALTWMASSCAQIKDIFVMRVGRLMARFCHVTTESGLSEATLTATDDGLFDAELLRVDEKGTIWGDVKATFAAAVQDQVPVPTSIRLGTLTSSQEDREETLRLRPCFQSFHSAGRTEAESVNNAFKAQAILKARLEDDRANAGHERSTYVQLKPMELYVAAPPEPKWDKHTAESSANAACALESAEESTPSIQHLHSPFSTGTFTGEPPDVATNGEENDSMASFRLSARTGKYSDISTFEFEFTKVQNDTLQRAAAEPIFVQASEFVEPDLSDLVTPQQVAERR